MAHLVNTTLEEVVNSVCLLFINKEVGEHWIILFPEMYMTSI